MTIVYAIEPELAAEEFVGLLRRSTLADRRPVDDPTAIAQMLQGATLILTARSGPLLVGVSRALTDSGYCTYLSDLAVDQAFQGQGIGRELIERTHAAAGLNTTLVLIAAPGARSYYPHIGMTQHDSCWILRPGDAVTPEDRSRDTTSPKPSSAPEDEQKSASKVGSFFDAMAPDYDEAILKCFPHYPEMLESLIQYLPPAAPKPIRILELGCGTGNLTRLLAKRYEKSKLTIVDVSQASLKTCCERLPTGTPLEALHRDMRDLDFATNSFDLVVSSIAIHHLNATEKLALFAKCFQWLEDFGTLTIADQLAADDSDVHQAHIAGWNRLAFSAGASPEDWTTWMDHQSDHDHHESLASHFNGLLKAGFRQPDCLWRKLLWTILQAQKAPPR